MEGWRNKATQVPPQLVSPGGAGEGGVVSRAQGSRGHLVGGFSQWERRKGTGSSSSFWSCLHTSWDGELTDSHLPGVNLTSCSSLAVFPE